MTSRVGFHPRRAISGRVGTLSAALLLFLSGCTAATHRPPRTPDPAVGFAGCTVREVSRERLLVEGGRQLHVEPAVLAANPHGDVLLAGRFNYLFERSPEGKWRFAAPDSAFGAVVGRTGTARLVRSPIPSNLLNSVHAVARPDGKWAVVFAETTATTAETRPDTAIRLWYGVLDGARWAALEQIPMPPSITLRTANSSSLVLYGDTLAWAMQGMTRDHRRDVVVFERRDGKWSHEVVRTLVASYTDLAHSDTLGLVLATVQPDLTLPSDANSLFLWVRRPGWRTLAKVVSGGSSGLVHNPRLDLAHGRGVLGWRAEVEAISGNTYQARAMAEPLKPGSGSYVTLDPALTPLTRVAPAWIPERGHLWVLDHRTPGGGEREIRFVQSTDESGSVLARITNPFIDRFSAAPVGRSGLLVVGGVIDREQDIAASLLVRFELDCGAREKR